MLNRKLPIMQRLIYGALISEKDDVEQLCRKALVGYAVVMALTSLMKPIQILVSQEEWLLFVAVLIASLISMGIWGLVWKMRRVDTWMIHVLLLISNALVISVICFGNRRIMLHHLLGQAIVSRCTLPTFDSRVHHVISIAGTVINIYNDIAWRQGGSALGYEIGHAAVDDDVFYYIVVLVVSLLLLEIVRVHVWEHRMFIERLDNTLKIAHKLSKAISGYDMELAIKVFQESSSTSADFTVLQPFHQIVFNLISYKPYLPASVVAVDPNYDVDITVEDAPNIVTVDPSLPPALVVEDVTNGPTRPPSLHFMRRLSKDSQNSSGTFPSGNNNNGITAETEVDSNSLESRSPSTPPMSPAFEDPRVTRLKKIGFRTYRAAFVGVSCDVPSGILADPTQVYLRSQTFLQTCIDCLEKGKGIVISMSGDKVVAGWNTFQPCASPEDFACEIAVELRQQLMLNKIEGPNIVVTAGKVFAGFSGSLQRKSPVVMGSAMQDLEDLFQYATSVPCNVVATEQVVFNCRGKLQFSPIDVLSFTRGYDAKVYEVLLAKDITLREKEIAKEYSESFSAFALHNQTEAFQKLSRVVELVGEDEISNSRASLFGNIHAAHACRIARITQLTQLPLGTREIPNPYVRKLEGWKPFESIADIHTTADHMPLLLFEYATSHGLLHEMRTAALTSLSSATPQSSEAVLSTSALVDIRTEVHNQRTMLEDFPSDDDSDDEQGVVVDFVAHDGVKYHRSKRILGKGVTAEVYVGMQENGALVALKFVEIPKVSGSQSRLDAVITEVGLLQKLQHDNITSYLGTAILRHHVVVVMEYVSGGSLGSTLEIFGKIHLASLKRYLQDILHGLNYLHKNGIAHRDIKPHNVLLMIDGQCKLTDFGAAAYLNFTMTSQSGQGNEVCGTPLYMAPEAALGHATLASDIWSLGVMTIELATGRIPWKDDQINGQHGMYQFIARLSKDDDMVPQIPQHMDEDLQDLCRKCLQRTARKRSTVQDLLVHRFLL